MYGKQIAGFILILFGGISVVNPQAYFKFKIWTSKKIYGIDIKPSSKTYKIQRALGILFIVLGCLILGNII